MTSKILLDMQQDNLNIQSRRLVAEVETHLTRCDSVMLRVSFLETIQNILLGQSSGASSAQVRGLNETLGAEYIFYTRLYASNLSAVANFNLDSSNLTSSIPISMFPLETNATHSAELLTTQGLVLTNPEAVNVYNQTIYCSSFTIPVLLSSQVTTGVKSSADLVDQASAPIIGFLTGVAEISKWKILPLDTNLFASLGSLGTSSPTVVSLMPLANTHAKRMSQFANNYPYEILPHDWDILNTHPDTPITSDPIGGLLGMAALKSPYRPLIVTLYSRDGPVGRSQRSLLVSLIIAACIACFVGLIVLFLVNRWRTRNLVNLIKSTEKRKRALDESRKRSDEDVATDHSSTLSFDESYLRKEDTESKLSFWPWRRKHNSAGTAETRTPNGTVAGAGPCAEHPPGSTEDPEAQPAHHHSAQQTVASGAYKRHFRFNSVHFNDEAVDMAKRIDSIFDALILQYKVLEDRVGERQQQIAEAKRAADEANAAKSHFLARVTHELRTPLNGILGTASLCMDEDDIPQIRSSLKTIYKCGELLLHLLTDLLSFSQSESERVELDEQEMMIDEITAQISAIFREQTEKANIDLQMRIDPECSRLIVFGDLNRILQVIFNLLSNSIKFTPNGGRIEFIVNAKKIENGAKRLVTCIVRDNGPGIAPHLQRRVFEAFVQGDITNKVRKAGVGLGLSICKQLAQRMGGTITLRSKLGEGAEFTFQIPLRYVGIHSPAASQESANNENIWPEYEHYNTSTIMRKAEAELGVSRKLSTTNASSLTTPTSASPSFERHSHENPPLIERADSSSSSEPGSVRPPLYRGLSMKGSNVDPDLRVLVADDNKVNQEVMIRMLNLEGLKNIVVADDGLEAIDKTEKAQADGKLFDIIFMDVQMPNCDGKKATQSIRNMGITIPIVAVSAYANEENIEACLEAGMNLFLAKPLRRPSLHKLLEGLQEVGIPEEDVPEMPEVPKI